MLGNLVHYDNYYFFFTLEGKVHYQVSLKKLFYVILKKVKFSLKHWSHVYPKDDDWLYQKGIWPLCRTKPGWKCFGNSFAHENISKERMKRFVRLIQYLTMLIISVIRCILTRMRN